MSHPDLPAVEEPASLTEDEESKAHRRAVRILKLARLHYRRRLRRLSYSRWYA